MTTPFICVFLAFLLIYAMRGPAMLAQYRRPEGYDNKHPRQQQAKLEGWGARAAAAHQNAVEAFGPFAAAVVVAHLAGLDPRRATLLSVTFVVSRVLYNIAYLANLDYLRTAIWSVGFLATAGLFVLPWL
jgi:uncharacterized MAPEG superfamily protein